MDHNHYSLLILSLVAISSGPLLYQLYTYNKKALDIVDRTVFLIVGGLVVFHLVPHALEDIGWLAFPLLFLGASIPAIIEKGRDSLHEKAHRTTIIIICIGILLHTFLDGMALLMPHKHSHDADFGLPLAVIFHRIPVGLTIWMLARPQYKTSKAIGIIAVLCLATTLGFLLSSYLSGIIDNTITSGINAIVSGSLLHILFHRPHYPDHNH